MKYRLSRRSILRLNGIHPILFKIVKGAIEHEDCPFDFGIPRFGGRRSKEDQIKMYSLGRSTEELKRKGLNIEGKPHKSKVTWTLNSNHLAKEDGFGYAFDIYAFIKGDASWDLKYLRPIARHLQWYAKEFHNVELEWGQDLWGKDGAHFQVKTFKDARE